MENLRIGFETKIINNQEHKKLIEELQAELKQKSMKVENLQSEHDSLLYKIDSLESQVSSLENEVDTLKYEKT